MASGQRESSVSDKGKGLRIKPSSLICRIDPFSPRGSSPKLLGSAIRAHRRASIESIARDRTTVEKIGKDGNDCRESDNGEGVSSVDTRTGSAAEDGAKGRSIRSSKLTRQCVPFRCCQGGRIEQLLDLAPGFVRSSSTEGREWGDVLPTRSTVGSVTSLLKECRAYGVTFVIPSSNQRPWTPPAKRLADSKRLADLKLDVGPSKKKKKKKSKSSKKAASVLGDGEDLIETDQGTSDCSTDGVKGPRESAEEDRTGLSIAKRKEPTDGGALDFGGKRLKGSHDSCSRSSKEIALPASRLLPWGGSDPPSDRPAPALSERLTFRHDKDTPFISDPGACAELMRQIRGGTHLMPEIPKLAFPDRYVESAQADMEAVLRKNQLIADYELALRGMASDFARAEATIEAKDVEIEKLKKAALEKSKEIINE
ncbi:hypothetical protein Bca4012_010494 [Brassica carinata]